MSLMNEILKYFIGKFVVVYLDNILIFRKTTEEHLRHLRLVMRILQYEKLLINLKKSSFTKIELIYLGFVISSNELKMDPEKVRAIIEWTSTRSMFEVSMFHGLAILYRNFNRDFSGICAPMMDTVKKKHKSFQSQWSHERILYLVLIHTVEFHEKDLWIFLEDSDGGSKRFSSSKIEKIQRLGGQQTLSR
jgi:hypothetical protein